MILYSYIYINIYTNLRKITILLFIINLVFCINYKNSIYITNGLDSTSLYGANIVSNDEFILISSNGYNIFNGAVASYYNNYLSESDEKLKIHSIIYPPEISNSNFGVRINVHNDILIISAIANKMYTGTVYIYKLYQNNWILIQQLYPINNVPYKKPIGFGYDIAINDKYLAIGCTSEQIYIYWFNNNKFQLIGNIIGKEQSRFGNKITFFENILFASLNKFPDLININQHNYASTVSGFNIDKLFWLNNSVRIINDNQFNFKIESPDNSKYNFFGSNIKNFGDKLIISCSIPYPFYNFDANYFDANNFKPKIIIYSIKHNKKTDNLEYNITNIITTDENDIYFGTNFDFDIDNLFISGTNKIYQYVISDNNFGLINIPKNIYDVPDNYINNDYKVKITKKSVLIGSYGSNDLEGSLYSINYNDINDDNTNTQKLSSARKKNFKSPLIFILILCMLLFLTILTIIIIASYLYYFFGYPYSNLINNKKKKKEEEEEYSPYKVYSYLGYCETDEFEYQNNIINYPPYPSVSLYPYDNQQIQNMSFNKIKQDNLFKPIKSTIQDKRKELYKKDKNIYKSDNIEHIIGKEKVYSYKEYEFDEKNKKIKNQK